MLGKHNNSELSLIQMSLTDEINKRRSISPQVSSELWTKALIYPHQEKI